MAQTLEQLSSALLLLRHEASLLWPGFAPATTPFMVFDGQDTYLLGAVPPLLNQWQPFGKHWTLAGRHPQLHANTALLLDEVLPVATLLLNDLPGDLLPAQLAALAAHEAFHVHQCQHPSRAWTADELSALTYPVGNEAVLVARAMETEMLQRALHSPGNWNAFAAQALYWRAQRFQQLPAAHAEYERSLERVEGLAHHVELQVLKTLPTLVLPDVPAEEVRGRTYTVGAVYAALLDRLGENWPSEDWRVIVQQDGTALDRLLARGVFEQLECGAALPVREEVRCWARGEAGAVLQRQQAALETFGALPGQRLTLRVKSREPLWPLGFDPLNIRELADGSVLHQRFLRFGNAGVEGEVLGAACRTWGWGNEPLRNGFRQVEVVGVRWEEQADGIRVHSPQVSIWVAGGQVQPDTTGWSCWT